MAWYGMVLVYHVNTQCFIESPLAGIAQLYWPVKQPIAFSQLRSLTRKFRPDTEELHGFNCNAIFFTCMHAHKSLSNKT